MDGCKHTIDICWLLLTLLHLCAPIPLFDFSGACIIQPAIVGGVAASHPPTAIKFGGKSNQFPDVRGNRSHKNFDRKGKEFGQERKTTNPPKTIIKIKTPVSLSLVLALFAAFVPPIDIERSCRWPVALCSQETDAFGRLTNTRGLTSTFTTFQKGQPRPHNRRRGSTSQQSQLAAQVVVCA